MKILPTNVYDSFKEWMHSNKLTYMPQNLSCALTQQDILQACEKDAIWSGKPSLTSYLITFLEIIWHFFLKFTI